MWTFAIAAAQLSWAAEPGGGVGVPPPGTPAPIAVEEAMLGWHQVGLLEADDERPAMGPELLTAGPGGRAALFDPVNREVLLLQDLALVGTMGMPRADGMAFTGDGALLVLDETARVLSMWADDGAPRGHLAVPQVVPPGGRLVVQGDLAATADAFGNAHPIAQIGAQSLGRAAGPRLYGPAHTARWDARTGVASVDDEVLAIPDAIKAGVRTFEGGDALWAVVDAVVADSPIEVHRTAWLVGSPVVVDLDIAGRLYAPAGDVAVDPDGRLYAIRPGPDGLHLLRATP